MNLVYSSYLNFQKAMKFLGLDIAIKKTIKNNNHYETIFPAASYAPWLSDKKFQDTYKHTKEYTLVDKYRCYELWQLVEEVAGLEGGLIEIGVWRGGTGALIAQKAKLCNIKNTVYLCDTFKGVVKAGEHDSGYSGGEHADTSKEIAEEIVNKFKLDNVKFLTGIFPDETSNQVEEKHFRFCHIDVDVYQSSKDILDWIRPKLVIGGIIVFDDYGFITCDGIMKFVNEQRGKKDRVVIHNLNGHAIIIKLSN